MNGGAAFPSPGVVVTDGRGDPYHQGAYEGMTLRDYFMAHAPAEPQPWFKPAMPAHPAAPGIPKDMTDEERHEWRGIGEYFDAKDCTSPRIRVYGLAYEAWQKADRAWMVDQEKQRYIQWPAAWADEMLKQRGDV